MDISELLCGPAECLVEAAVDADTTRPRPLPCDSFVARSAMQKAIRRGSKEIALRAAATVMLTNSAIVWRRLLVTALEDLGIHQIELLIRIAAAIERRRFGHHLKDEWPLIAQLVVECCEANRCQAANDLHNLSLNSSDYDGFRSASANLLPRDLIAMASDPSRDLIERNIAIVTCLGADHAPWSLQRTMVEPEAIIAAVGRNVNPAVRAIYAWAFRKSRLPLATSSLLLVSAEGGVEVKPCAFDDDVPEFTWVHGVPGFAFDQYTRGGRRVIADYVDVSDAWRLFGSKLHLSKSAEKAAAGELLFRVEGAVVSRRSSWDGARVLSQLSRTVGCHLPKDAVEDGLRIVRSELRVINQLRYSLPFDCSGH